jgi:hypothetical protein
MAIYELLYLAIVTPEIMVMATYDSLSVNLDRRLGRSQS